MKRSGNIVRPFGDQARQGSGVAVILAHGAFFADARRAKKHDRVLDFLVAEMRQRLQVFGKDAQAAGVRTLQESLVEVSHRTAAVVDVILNHCEGAWARSSSPMPFSNCLTVFNRSGSFGKAVPARTHSPSPNPA